MKITEHIKKSKGKTRFTFEILPPVKGHSIQSIYENRKALYEEISDMTITTDPLTINSLCNKIIEKCKIEKFFS